MSRFEILSDSHKIQVADFEKDQKWVFSKNHRYSGDEISVGGVSKIVHSTKDVAITADEYGDAKLQDVPEELFDFLDSEGYHTEFARNSVQF